MLPPVLYGHAAMDASVTKLSFAEVVGLGERKKKEAKAAIVNQPRSVSITAMDVPVAWAPVPPPRPPGEAE